MRLCIAKRQAFSLLNINFFVDAIILLYRGLYAQQSLDKFTMQSNISFAIYTPKKKRIQSIFYLLIASHRTRLKCRRERGTGHRSSFEVVTLFQALSRRSYFFAPPLFSLRSLYMQFYIENVSRMWHSIDEAKIIPPCHVNEHIIFDLISGAICCM